MDILASNPSKGDLIVEPYYVPMGDKQSLLLKKSYITVFFMKPRLLSTESLYAHKTSGGILLPSWSDIRLQRSFHFRSIEVDLDQVAKCPSTVFETELTWPVGRPLKGGRCLLTLYCQKLLDKRS